MQWIGVVIGVVVVGWFVSLAMHEFMRFGVDRLRRMLGVNRLSLARIGVFGISGIEVELEERILSQITPEPSLLPPKISFTLQIAQIDLLWFKDRKFLSVQVNGIRAEVPLKSSVDSSHQESANILEMILDSSRYVSKSTHMQPTSSFLVRIFLLFIKLVSVQISDASCFFSVGCMRLSAIRFGVSINTSPEQSNCILIQSSKFNVTLFDVIHHKDFSKYPQETIEFFPVICKIHSDSSSSILTSIDVDFEGLTITTAVSNYDLYLPFFVSLIQPKSSENAETAIQNQSSSMPSFDFNFNLRTFSLQFIIPPEQLYTLSLFYDEKLESLEKDQAVAVTLGHIHAAVQFRSQKVLAQLTSTRILHVQTTSSLGTADLISLGQLSVAMDLDKRTQTLGIEMYTHDFELSLDLSNSFKIVISILKVFIPILGSIPQSSLARNKSSVAISSSSSFQSNFVINVARIKLLTSSKDVNLASVSIDRVTVSCNEEKVNLVVFGVSGYSDFRYPIGIDEKSHLNHDPLEVFQEIRGTCLHLEYAEISIFEKIELEESGSCVSIKLPSVKGRWVSCLFEASYPYLEFFRQVLDTFPELSSQQLEQSRTLRLEISVDEIIIDFPYCLIMQDSLVDIFKYTCRQTKVLVHQRKTKGSTTTNWSLAIDSIALLNSSSCFLQIGIAQLLGSDMDENHPKSLKVSADKLRGYWDPDFQVRILKLVKDNIASVINLKHRFFSCFPKQYKISPCPEMWNSFPISQSCDAWKFNRQCIIDFWKWFHVHRAKYLPSEFIFVSLDVSDVKLSCKPCSGASLSIQVEKFQSEFVPNYFNFKNAKILLDSKDFVSVECCVVSRLGDDAEKVWNTPSFDEERNILHKYCDMSIALDGVVLRLPSELDFVLIEVIRNVRAIVSAFYTLPSLDVLSKSRNGPGYVGPPPVPSPSVSTRLSCLCLYIEDDRWNSWLQLVNPVWLQEKSRQESLLELLRMKIRERSLSNSALSYEEISNLQEQIFSMNYRSYKNLLNARILSTLDKNSPSSFPQNGQLLSIEVSEIVVEASRQGFAGNFWNVQDQISFIQTVKNSCSSDSLDGSRYESKILEFEQTTAMQLLIQVSPIRVGIRKFPMTLFELNVLNVIIPVVVNFEEMSRTSEKHRIFSAFREKSSRIVSTIESVSFDWKCFYKLQLVSDSINVFINPMFRFSLLDVFKRVKRLLSSQIPAEKSSGSNEILSKIMNLAPRIQGLIDSSIVSTKLCVSVVNDAYDSSKFLEIVSSNISLHIHDGFLRFSVGDVSLRLSQFSHPMVSLADAEFCVWILPAKDMIQLDMPLGVLTLPQIDVLTSFHLRSIDLNLNQSCLVTLILAMKKLSRQFRGSHSIRTSLSSFVSSTSSSLAKLFSHVVLLPSGFNNIVLKLWDSCDELALPSQGFRIDFSEVLVGLTLARESLQTLSTPNSTSFIKKMSTVLLISVSAWEDADKSCCLGLSNFTFFLGSLCVSLVKNDLLKEKQCSSEKKKFFEDLSSGRIVVVATYENQRRYIRKEFRSMLLPTDRPPWSDERGSESLPKDSTAFNLPDGWEWLGPWEVDFKLRENGEVDEEGWEYANDFPRKYIGRKTWYTNVRRRRWIRTRKLKAETLSIPKSETQASPKESMCCILIVEKISCDQVINSEISIVPDNHQGFFLNTLSTRKRSSGKQSSRSELKIDSADKSFDASHLLKHFSISSKNFSRHFDTGSQEATLGSPFIPEDSASLDKSFSDSRDAFSPVPAEQQSKLLLKVRSLQFLFTIESRDATLSLVDFVYRQLVPLFLPDETLEFLKVTESNTVETDHDLKESLNSPRQFSDELEEFLNRDPSNFFALEATLPSYEASEHEVDDEDEDVLDSATFDDVRDYTRRLQLAKGSSDGFGSSFKEPVSFLENLLTVEIKHPQVAFQSQKSGGRILCHLGSCTSDLRIVWVLPDDEESQSELERKPKFMLRERVDFGFVVGSLRFFASPFGLDVNQGILWIDSTNFTEVHEGHSVWKPFSASIPLSMSTSLNLQQKKKNKVALSLSIPLIHVYPDSNILVLVVGVLQTIAKTPVPFAEKFQEELSTFLYWGQLETQPENQIPQLIRQRSRIRWQLNHLTWLLDMLGGESDQPEVAFLEELYNTLENSLEDVSDELKCMLGIFKMRSKDAEAQVIMEAESGAKFSPEDPDFSVTIKITISEVFAELILSKNNTKLMESRLRGIVVNVVIGDFLEFDNKKTPQHLDVSLEVTSIEILNCLSEGEWRNMVAQKMSPESTNRSFLTLNLVRRNIGGIMVFPHFDVNLDTLRINITQEIISRLIEFFSFGRRNTRRDHQFIVPSKTNILMPSKDMIPLRDSDCEKKPEENDDEIANSFVFDRVHAVKQMKLRSKQNVNFNFARIGAVDAIVSYKGGKQFNLEDFEGLNIKLKPRIYQNRSMSVENLGKRLRRDYIKSVLSQVGDSIGSFLRFKLGLTDCQSTVSRKASHEVTPLVETDESESKTGLTSGRESAAMKAKKFVSKVFQRKKKESGESHRRRLMFGSDSSSAKIEEATRKQSEEHELKSIDEELSRLLR